MTGDVSERFDRLPQEATEKGESREAILSWWDDRFGIDSTVFDAHTFWERGEGNIWVFYGEVPDPSPFDGLGMVCVRTSGHDWKPTTNAAQRFGHHATRNVLEVGGDAIDRFVAGETQSIAWTGDRGYVLVATEVAGERAILGVGQHLDGELRSVIPKGRRRDLLR